MRISSRMGRLAKGGAVLAGNGRDILQGRLSQPPAAQFQKGGVVSNGNLNGDIIWGAHVSEEQKPVVPNPYRDTITGLKSETKKRAMVNPTMNLSPFEKIFAPKPKFEKGGTMNFKGADQLVRRSPDAATNRKKLLSGGADVTMYPLVFKNGGSMTDPVARRGLLAGGVDATLYPLPFKHGGGIHIKPENRGKFNATKAATGKSTEELTHSSNPVTRKRAIFAQNAAKWHHAQGGVIKDDQLGKGTPAHLDSGAGRQVPATNTYLPYWGPQAPFYEQHVQNDAIKMALSKAKGMAPQNNPTMDLGGQFRGYPRPQFGKYGLDLDLARLGNANFGDKTVLPNVGLPRVRTKNPS